jgi:hypothetical protein
MHSTPHPKAGRQITVNLGDGPHLANYDDAIHGKSFELGDWLDRVSLDERITARVAELGIQWYANRCMPHLPASGVTQQMLGNADLVYCLHPVEFEGRKGIRIIVLAKHEWT